MQRSCRSCRSLHREAADKIDALFVSANSHLLVSRNANFGKMVKSKLGNLIHAPNSPEAKGLALGDVKWLGPWSMHGHGPWSQPTRQGGSRRAVPKPSMCLRLPMF